MATQVVEISGDAAKLLRVYDEAIRKEKEHYAALERTGKAGQAAGDDIGEGMARATKNTQRDFERLTRELRGFGDEGRAAAAALKTHLQDAGKAGHRSMTAVLDALGELDPAARAAAEAAGRSLEASGDDAFREAIEQLRRLGPAGAQAADRIQKDIDAAAAGSVGSIAEIAARLEALGPEGATTAERIRQNFTEASRQIEFDATLAELRGLGSEGSTIADRIRRQMKQAATDAAGGMTAILDRLRQIDPAAADAGEAIKAEMEEAARYSDGKFEETLRTLRSMGPVGKQVADELRKDLVKAGQISERSIEDVVASLRKIDPAAADAAVAIQRKIEGAAEKGESAWTRFSNTAVTQIGAVVTAYAGVANAVQAVNRFLTEQEQLIESARDSQIDLAKAQQETMKNLAGLSVVQQNELLQKAAPEIAAATGTDVANITTALGAAVSRGADPKLYPGLAEAAVLAAARTEQQTPDRIDDTTAGAVAVARQTGLPDIRQSVALLQTTGTQAAITDPKSLTESAPTAIASAMSTVPDQGREEAARQAGALFATLTQAANDQKGDSTKTFQIALTGRLGTFFSNLEQQRVEARSELERLNNKKNPLEKDIARAEELKQQIPALETLRDPGTLFGRVEALQQSPAARDYFLKDRFGEEQFSVARADLFRPESQSAKLLQQAFSEIRASVEFFESTAERLATGTPQLQIAASASRRQSVLTSGRVIDSEGASLKEVRDTVSEALSETNQGGLAGFFESTRDAFIGRGTLTGGTAAEEAVSGLRLLSARLSRLESGGVSDSEASDVFVVRGAMENLVRLVETRAESGGFSAASIPLAIEKADIDRGVRYGGTTADELAKSPHADLFDRMVAALERSNELAQRQAAAAERTATSSEKTATNTGRQPTPNYNSAQQTAAAAATP